MLDELREDNAIISDSDETSTILGDEKRSVWIAENGSGRLKKANSKGEIKEMSIAFE